MDKRDRTDENLQTQIAKAREKAAILSAVEPRAEAAYYDRETGRVVIHLRHGAIFSFPARLGQGLTGATPDDLADVVVTPSGTGLHWAALDADLSIPALLNGIYGDATWMAQVMSLN
ncbi:MAG: DUF2442 domain-containing protein [Leptolyngbyaceae cyanobacterium bins.349]|nr:DUF2442 domain-containing protein [Leptolyngbyaceae cyanobacterium bins.349]